MKPELEEVARINAALAQLRKQRDQLLLKLYLRERGFKEEAT